jgi:hypothetical protein
MQMPYRRALVEGKSRPREKGMSLSSPKGSYYYVDRMYIGEDIF